MPWCFCLPSLLCGLAVSVEDVRHRRVPRLWIAVGSLAQLISTLVWAVVGNAFFTLVQSVLFALLCMLVQFALALVRPGSLGFGDVTVTLAMGLAVGAYGLTAVVIWWVLIGALGLVFILLWTRFDPQRHTPYRGKVPFAPVIVVAAALVVIAAPLL